MSAAEQGESADDVRDDVHDREAQAEAEEEEQREHSLPRPRVVPRAPPRRRREAPQAAGGAGRPPRLLLGGDSEGRALHGGEVGGEGRRGLAIAALDWGDVVNGFLYDRNTVLNQTVLGSKYLNTI